MEGLITLGITRKHLPKLGSDMKSWEVLQQKEYDWAWNFVRARLLFHPYEKKGNVVVLPKSNKCFDTSEFFGDNFEQKLYDELHDFAQEWFKFVCGGQRMYALDWQDECYSFDPFLPFEKNEFDEWLISVFPNGDYLFF